MIIHVVLNAAEVSRRNESKIAGVLYFRFDSPVKLITTNDS